MDEISDDRGRFLRWPRAIGFFSAVVVGLFVLITEPKEFCIDYLACSPPQPAERRYGIQDYITESPEDPPAKESSEFDLLGLGHGGSSQRISDAFPPDATHSIGPDGGLGPAGWHDEKWTWKGITVTARVQSSSGSAGGIRVFRDETSPYFVSAPRKLLLGHSTMQDAIDTYGSALIDYDVETETEGQPHYYSANFSYGAEGLLQFEYLANAADSDSPDDDTTTPTPYPPGSPQCQGILRMMGENGDIPIFSADDRQVRDDQSCKRT